MAIAHCSMFFAQGNRGWVEQFWRSDASLLDSLNATVALAGDRWSILAAGINLYRVRVSALGVPRCSLSALAPGIPLAALAGPAEQGVEIRLQAGNRGLYRRTLFLRGLPATAIAAVGESNQWNSPYGPLVDRWLRLLISGGWMMQAWGRESPAYPILNLAETLDNSPYTGPPPYPPDLGWNGWTSIIATVAGNPELPGLEPGVIESPTVRIGRVKWSTGRGHANGVNGEYAPFQGGPGFLQYLGSLPSTGNYLGGGYLQIRPRLYVPIRQADLLRVGVRATGPAPLNTSTHKLTSAQVQSILQIQQGFQVPVPPGFAAPPGLVPAVIPPPLIPPPAGTRVYSTQDVLSYIHLRVQGGVFPVYTPLGTAPILNHPGWYAVFANGTYFGADIAGGLSAVSSAFKINTDYINLLRRVLKEQLPPDAPLVLFGYSQGGMTIETVLSEGIEQPVILIAEFGSPLVSLDIMKSYTVTYYNVIGDLVPFLSPWSSTITMSQSKWYGKMIGFNFPFVSVLIDINNPVPFNNHINMYLNADLDNYAWSGGARSTNNYLVIGPLTLYPVIPSPP